MTSDFTRWWHENVPKGQGMGTLTVDHPRWEEFLGRLCSPAYLDVRWDSSVGDWKWTCPRRNDPDFDRPLTRRLMGEMGFTEPEIEMSLDYFADHGGCCCDCEVWMNVDHVAPREAESS